MQPAASTAPRKSNLCFARGIGGSTRTERISAITTNGMFTANSHCHGATDRMIEATVGPRVMPVDTTMALTPTPRPRMRFGQMKRISAELTLIMPLEPRPWISLAATSISKVGASAQPIAPRPNRMRPP